MIRAVWFVSKFNVSVAPHEFRHQSFQARPKEQRRCQACDHMPTFDQDTEQARKVFIFYFVGGSMRG